VEEVVSSIAAVVDAERTRRDTLRDVGIILGAAVAARQKRRREVTQLSGQRALIAALVASMVMRFIVP
jgi:nucleoside permease NupC